MTTNAVEQTFSWYKNYAKTVIDMIESRARFLSMVYVKRHNELVAEGGTSHLNVFAELRQKSRVKGMTKGTPYDCAPNAEKARKA